MSEGDGYMELFEKEVKRLNENQKFTAFMTPEEENEKLIKTLISEAKTDGEQIGQKKTNLSVAKKMLLKKMSLKDISDITGLSKKEIETLM